MREGPFSDRSTKNLAINSRRIAPEASASKIHEAIDESMGRDCGYEYIRKIANSQVKGGEYSIEELEEEIDPHIWSGLAHHLESVGVEEIYSSDGLPSLEKQLKRWSENREERNEPKVTLDLIAVYELHENISYTDAARLADCSKEQARRVKNRMENDDFSEDMKQRAKNREFYELEKERVSRLNDDGDKEEPLDVSEEHSESRGNLDKSKMDKGPEDGEIEILKENIGNFEEMAEKNGEMEKAEAYRFVVAFIDEFFLGN